MITYRLAEGKDMENIIDLIDMVFSMVRVPHDFEKLLPKVYAHGQKHAEIHVIAQEDERICGCMGMHVFPLRVAGETLRVGYLGSMAVHPRARGQGVMQQLVRRQTARGREMGLDLILLGGQRQRYQRFGYETVGADVTYRVTAGNIRHAMRDLQVEDYAFAPMQEADAAFACQLYDAQIVAGARTQENFLDTVRSYGEKPYVLLVHGEPAGYMVVADDGETITEIVTCKAADLLPAIKAYTVRFGVRAVSVIAAPYDTQLNAQLAPICDGYTISANCMALCIDPVRVVGAYMKLRQEKMEPLEDGRMLVDWPEYGTVLICVKDGVVSVERSQEPPQVALDVISLHQMLFGFNRFGYPDWPQAPRSWFPLPLHIPVADSF